MHTEPGVRQMNRLLIIVLVAIGWLAVAQRSTAQAVVERFLVYNLAARIDAVGQEYAKDDQATRGNTSDTWYGKLVIDLNSQQANLIWRTTLYGTKVQQVIDLKSAARLFRVDYNGNGGSRDMITMAAARNRAGFPSGESASLLWLRGYLPRNLAIGGTNESSQPTRELLSLRFSGEFWFLDETTQSYRTGRLSARYVHADTNFANTELGNYDNSLDGFVDMNDLVEYWKDALRVEGWSPIAE